MGLAKLAGWLATNAIALAVACQLFDGIGFRGASQGSAELSDKLGPLLLVALLLGIVSSFVAPVVRFLSLPFIIVTLGLFLLLINALMLEVTEWLSGALGIAFFVHGFWTAVGGALVITVVTWIVGLVLGDLRDG